MNNWTIAAMLIAIAAAVLLIAALTGCDGFASICDADVTLANDPRAPEYLCAYKSGSAVECGLTPQAVAARCGR